MFLDYISLTRTVKGVEGEALEDGRHPSVCSAEPPRLLLHESPCHYCNSVTSGDARAAFHSDCSSCSDAERRHGNQDLCGFCRHLRLRHLVRCCARDMGFLDISLGTFADLDRDCVLCRAFAGAIRQEVELMRELSGDDPAFSVPLALVFSQPRPRSVATAGRDSVDGEMAGPRAYLRNRFALRVECANVGDGINRRFLVYMYCGEQMDRVEVSPLVQWDILQGWLTAASTRDLKRPVQGLRVVDVNAGIVVLAHDSCEYATLSYVWGSVGGQRAWLGRGADGAASTDAIEESELPATIADAMAVCRGLRIRYLWIDSLCILQDDEADKNYQISQMDRIYLGAVVCIVAAAGRDAKHGLPGVSPSRRRVWHVSHARISDIEVKGGPEEFEQYINRTAWNSRGWTFQEFMLSDRLLYFTALGAFFYDRRAAKMREASEAFRLDGLHLDGLHSVLAEHESVKRHRLLGKSAEESYGLIVWQYTQRTLTFEEDLLRAVGGVLNYCLPGGHSRGMAHEHFDRAIMWTTKYEAKSWRPPTSTVRFPTWSWASAYGQVVIGSGGHPVACWAVVDDGANNGERGQLTFMVPRQLPAWEEENDGIHKITKLDLMDRNVAAGLAWAHGCLETLAPEVVTSVHEHPAYSEPSELRSQWSSTFDYWTAAFGHCLESSSNPPFATHRFPFSDSDVALAGSAPGRILVRTQEVFFTTYVHTGSGEKFIDPFLAIENAAGTVIGGMHVGNRLAARLRAGWRGRARLIGLAVDVDRSGEHEFGWIEKILGRSMSFEHDLPSLAFMNRRGESIGLQTLLMKVMAVGLTDEGDGDRQSGGVGDDRLVERIAVGSVYLKQWVLADRRFRTLVLE